MRSARDPQRSAVSRPDSNLVGTLHLASLQLGYADYASLRGGKVDRGEERGEGRRETRSNQQRFFVSAITGEICQTVLRSRSQFVSSKHVGAEYREILSLSLSLVFENRFVSLFPTNLIGRIF